MSRRVLHAVLLVSGLALVACGENIAPSRASNAKQALTQNSEFIEFEPAFTRQELFREVARISAQEAGRPADQGVLFPIIRRSELVAAPALDARLDLLQAPDAGRPLTLSFDVRGGESWPEDRRDGLQGLSEREAAELVARSLLAHWSISPPGSVQVDRAAGAPYAAAYIDGILRLNPAFLYMATAVIQ